MIATLDRATCEALAKAYPEIARGRGDHGDLYYTHNQFGQPIYTTVGAFQCCKPWMPSKGDVWCPRLDDLLAIAENHGALLVTFAGRDRVWVVTIGDETWTGSSRESAIAAWLLARVQANTGGVA